MGFANSIDLASAIPRRAESNLKLLEFGVVGTTHITPNIDAIGEVTVITSGYTAENGRQSSGLIRIVTKSGTSQLKGSAWYNARRDQWNSNEYLRKKQGAEKPFFEKVKDIFG